MNSKEGKGYTRGSEGLLAPVPEVQIPRTGPIHVYTLSLLTLLYHLQYIQDSSTTRSLFPVAFGHKDKTQDKAEPRQTSRKP
jgi:hypothetical protein